jgi:tetratricopeptide (TPR) repeat protein
MAHSPKFIFHWQRFCWSMTGIGPEQKRRSSASSPLIPSWPRFTTCTPYCFLTLGRLDEAITEGRRALESDPLSLIYGRSLGMCLYFSRRYDEAVAQYHETLELDQNNVSVHELLGNAYERQGRHDEAIAEWQKTAVLTGDHELAASWGRACAKGDLARAVRERARKNLEQANEKARRGEYVPAIEYAQAWVSIGDSEQAFCWLEKVCSERNGFSLLVNSDPLYHNLRADKRFEHLQKLIGFVA